MATPKVTFSVLFLIVFVSVFSQKYALQANQSAIFTQVNGSTAFVQNILPSLSTNDSITEATGMMQGSDASIFVLGNIEASNLKGNSQTFATDELGVVWENRIFFF